MNTGKFVIKTKICRDRIVVAVRKRTEVEADDRLFKTPKYEYEYFCYEVLWRLIKNTKSAQPVRIGLGGAKIRCHPAVY